jgi:hypothetical protein
MTQDQFVAQAVVSGKSREEALALYAAAFPPAPAPAPDSVVGFKREVFPDGRVIETEFLANGTARVVSDNAAAF